MENSRDFQLLVRLWDLWSADGQVSAQDITSILDPMRAPEELLPKVAGRLGFFPPTLIDTSSLRHILSVFPYCIRRKGSAEGIRALLQALLRAQGYNESSVWCDVTYEAD